MKTPTIYFNDLTDEMLKSHSRIRIESKFLAYTIEIKTVSKNEYVYLYKKYQNKLYKVYVGSLADVLKNKEIIHAKVLDLDHKIIKDTYESTHRQPIYENIDRSYWVNKSS